MKSMRNLYGLQMDSQLDLYDIPQISIYGTSMGSQ